MIWQNVIYPGIFNINEPIMFGLPVLNPIMMVPFIMVPIVNCAIGSSLFRWKLSTGCLCRALDYARTFNCFPRNRGNWLALLVGFLCLGVATMIYLPFVIAANKVNNMTTNG